MKIYKVSSLPDGTRFIIPSLADHMRHLEIVKVTDCSTLIKGQERDSMNDPWKPLRYTICNSVEVVVDTSSEEDEVIQEKKSVIELPTNIIEKVEPVIKTRKHRKDIVLIFPSEKFSIKELSESSNVSTSNVYVKLQELLKAGKVKEVEKKRMNLKGKPTTFYAKTETYNE